MISSTITSGAEGARGDAEALDAVEHLPVEIGGALRQHRHRAALAFGNLAQPLRIRRIRRADHDQGIDTGATFLTASWRLVVA